MARYAELCGTDAREPAGAYSAPAPVGADRTGLRLLSLDRSVERGYLANQPSIRTGERMMQSVLSEFDRYLLAEGTFHRAYQKLGAHLTERDGQRGVQFALWAPNA